MPAIDGLLSLLDLQSASGLVLEAGRPPTLIVGGAERALTMPPLDAGVLRVVLGEAIGADSLSRVEGGECVEASYASPKVGTVALRASLAAGKLKLRVTRAAAASRAAPPVAPAETCVGDERTSAPAAPTVDARMAAGGRETRSPSSIWPLLRVALRRGASDIFLSTSSPPAVRVAGEVCEIDGVPPTEEELLGFLGPALGEAHRQTLAATGSVDLALEGTADDLGLEAARRFRVNLFRHLDGTTAAIRPLWERLPGLDDLHLPARLTRLVAPTSGMVLVAGLAGSGKSTTLAVLVEHINLTRARHVVTLEDPIEHVFRRRRSVIHQREVGSHIDSFASGLRAALRECPDVILVGEMRDRETIALALTAAETGHLVLSTIHSASAATAIDRFVDVFPEGQQAQARAQLGNVLRSVVTQRLLPGREPGSRVPVVEVLHVNYAVAAHIREGKTHLIPNQMQAGGDEAMVPHDRHLVELARRGLIAAQTAIEAARDKEFVVGALGAPR